jgi:hypothetical protein
MKRKLILRVMQTGFYAWLLLRVIPYIRFTTYYTSLRGWKYQRGYKLIQPADICLTLDRKKLTTLLIPGEFSHAAVCIDKGSEWEISEMTHTDYTKSCFFDLCKEADRVVILRCRDFDEEYRKNFIAATKSLELCKYDIEFSLGIDALACSELPFQADYEHRCRVSLEDIAGIGTPYISPTGWWNARKTNMDVIWDSDKEVRFPG